MRFNILSSIVSLAAIAAPLVLGQGLETNENIITVPAAGDTWSAGTPFDIIWTPSAAAPGTVSIILLKGLQTNLQVVETIAPGVANNGKFQWTPPLSLEGMQTMPADHIYGFKIVTDATGNFGWSPPFKLNSPQSTFAATGAATGVTTTDPATSATSATSETSISSAPTTTEASTSTTESTTATSETVASTTKSSATKSSTTQSSTVTTKTSSATSASSTAASTTEASETAAQASETETDTSEPTETAAPQAASGLSTVAIAGISASAVAALAIGILAFFLIRRRKRNSRQRLVGSTVPPSKYDKDFQMMERRVKHRPTSSFGFNTSRSDGSGLVDSRNDPYVQLDDRSGDYRAYPTRPSRSSRGSDTWNLEASRF